MSHLDEWRCGDKQTYYTCTHADTHTHTYRYRQPICSGTGSQYMPRYRQPIYAQVPIAHICPGASSPYAQVQIAHIYAQMVTPVQPGRQGGRVGGNSPLQHAVRCSPALVPNGIVMHMHGPMLHLPKGSCPSPIINSF